MLSSLRNWANHDRNRLRPSTPAQLCWSSSRLQPLQNYNPIKFAIIRPSALNYDRNLWNCRGAPSETTCWTVFFRCPSALILICTKLFNVCANNFSLSPPKFCLLLHLWGYQTLAGLNLAGCRHGNMILLFLILKQGSVTAVLSFFLYGAGCIFMSHTCPKLHRKITIQECRLFFSSKVDSEISSNPCNIHFFVLQPICRLVVSCTYLSFKQVGEFF